MSYVIKFFRRGAKVFVSFLNKTYFEVSLVEIILATYCYIAKIFAPIFEAFFMKLISRSYLGEYK